MRPSFRRLLRTALLGVLAVTLASSLLARPFPVRADGVSLLDLIDVDFGYTTIADDFYLPVTAQRLLDGARVGLVAYLRGRGIADPQVGFMHARSDGRGAVPAIERQIGLAIERYGGRVDAHALVDAAIEGELGALWDPYSVFFTAPQLKGFQAALDGSTFGGVGIELGYDAAAKTWRADAVFGGSPAARAGIRAGDVIAAVDGVAATGLSAGRISALLRGHIHTVVHLSIVRGGTLLPRPLALTRAMITPPDVTARLLPGSVGYVALRGFPLDAAMQVRAAVQLLAARGAHAYVFDLRGNGGGYESAAVHVASLFIPSGPVVSNRRRRGEPQVMMADGDALPPAPLVVLVDHDTASGAELVAAALQDDHLATIVGRRTFGKGVAQTMFPLPDGSAIKLTTARYFTPDGRSIEGTGVVPDVTVTQPADAARGVPGRDPQLDRALELLAARR